MDITSLNADWIVLQRRQVRLKYSCQLVALILAMRDLIIGICSLFSSRKKRKKGIFRYDRRVKDKPKVLAIVQTTWKDAANRSVMDHISLIRGAISRWNKEKQQNNRELIESKKTDLETALLNPTNDHNLIQRITKELQEAYKA